MTKREQYIIDNLKLDPITVKSVTEIGRIAGTHKYDVWIARETKKNNNILNNQRDIYFIIDWIKKDKPDIFTLTFSDAFKLAEEWHKNLEFKTPSRTNEDVKEDRIIFKYSDNKHFFLLLKPEELTIEGNLMRHCVSSYKQKVKSGHSLIISLRDDKNEPHVTIEIDTKSCTVVQIRGKANANPASKYLKMMTEFAIYASGYGESVDEELLQLMKMRFD